MKIAPLWLIDFFLISREKKRIIPLYFGSQFSTFSFILTDASGAMVFWRDHSIVNNVHLRVRGPSTRMLISELVFDTSFYTKNPSKVWISFFFFFHKPLLLVTFFLFLASFFCLASFVPLTLFHLGRLFGWIFGRAYWTEGFSVGEAGTVGWFGETCHTEYPDGCFARSSSSWRRFYYPLNISFSKKKKTSLLLSFIGGLTRFKMFGTPLAPLPLLISLLPKAKYEFLFLFSSLFFPSLSLPFSLPVIPFPFLHSLSFPFPSLLFSFFYSLPFFSFSSLCFSFPRLLTFFMMVPIGLLELVMHRMVILR